MKETKKAQIRMAETVTILLVFFVLLSLSMIFFTKLYGASASRAYDEKLDLQSVQIAQTVAFLSELQCTKKNVQTDNCFDQLKVESFFGLVSSNSDLKNQVYYDLFGNSKIVVTQTYPVAVAPNVGWSRTVYDRSLVEDYRTEKETQIPISLYTPLTDSYGFGVLTITTYQ